MAEEKKVAPVEDTKTETEVLREAQKGRQKMMSDLVRVPKRKVYGSKIHKETMGDRWTFLYNGVPVSINFDGTWQEFPEPIADFIEKQLEATAVANAPKEEFVKI
jgi:hypothetical protein